MWLILQGLWYLAGVGLHVVYKLAKWAQGQEAYLGFRGTMEAYWKERMWHILQAGVGSMLALGAWTSGWLLVPVNFMLTQGAEWLPAGLVVPEVPQVWWTSCIAGFALDWLVYQVIERVSKGKKK